MDGVSSDSDHHRQPGCGTHLAAGPSVIGPFR
jgi:hypothetical protein